MLRELFIQDIVLIDRLSLSLGGGLTALTGETGAGKSIMLDALGLAAGGRAEKGLVRQGAKQGVISATFDAGEDHEVWPLLEENGLTGSEETGEVILRRVQGADGRARAFVNDHPVSVSLLKIIGESLIEVHGQHAGQGFLHAGAHRDLLDEFGSCEKNRQDVHRAWTAWQDVKAELEERAAAKEQALREADYLRHVVGELGRLAPEPDEESNLAARRTTLMAAEKIAVDLADALAGLSDDKMESRLSSALGRIEKVLSSLDGPEGGKLSQVIERADTALAELQEARSAIEEAASSFTFDPEELNSVEERLFALRAAARKHNTTPDRLGEFLQKAEQSLNLLEAGEADFAALEKRVATAEKQYFLKAEKLSAARQKAAKALDKAVAAELNPLKLDRATFTVSLETDRSHAGPAGTDQVQFLIATNPGAAPGPLKQIASGGELSRFVLALKAALVAQENRTVIIFDEVDAGVGGAVADAVGERLAGLAAHAQVMVVTHSPQVAARAGRHLHVSKAGKSKVKTSVIELDAPAREEEIARMLSGARITKEARAAAAQLLRQVTKPARRKKTKAA